MMRKVLMFILLLLPALFVQGQRTGTVSGKVMENVHTPVIGAGVFLMYGKDTLRTVTDTAGRFSFGQVGSSTFRIRVRSLGYEAYQNDYEFAENQNINLDPVILKEETLMLKNVVINGKVVPVRFKEDTVEYDARAFKTMEKDRVTELLKRLPGVVIDKDGNVTSMGKTLTKIRVNGKDFFTGNVKEFIGKLPADIISKVQIIDDYGDHANFTGIKTGTPNKLLNLVTKDGIKGGIFGSGQLDVGSNKQYGATGDLNLWRKDKQIAVNGVINTQDNGAGKANAARVLSSYNDDLGKNITLKASYNYLRSTDNTRTLSEIETVVDQGVLYNKNIDNSYNENEGHTFVAGIEKKTAKDMLTLDLNASLLQNKSAGFSQSLQTGLNRQDLNNVNDKSGKTPTISSNLRYTRKFAKPGRSVEYNMNFSSQDSKLEEHRNDHVVYYNKLTGLQEKDSVLNRQIDEDKKHNTFGGGITYTEPLKIDPVTKARKSLSIGYSIFRENNKNHLSTFAGETEDLLFVDSLSNAFKTSFTKQEFVINYFSVQKGLRYSVGLKSMLSTLKGKYEGLSKGVDKSIFNLNPTISFSYIKNGSSFSLNLDQVTTPPDFSQLQPVPETRNLQRIVIGNPNLKPEAIQKLMLSYSKGWKSGLTMQTSIEGNLTQNKVAMNTFILQDTLNSLRQEIHYLNTNGDLDLKGSYTFFKTFNDSKYQLSLNGNVGYVNNVYFTENIKGFNKAINFSQSLSFQFNQKWLYSISTINYEVTNNNYTLGYANPSRIQTWGFQTNGQFHFNESYNIEYFLTKRINSGYSFDNSNPFIVQLTVNKFLFKKAGTIKLGVNDLFNQGNNQQRIFSANTTTDVRSNQVTRYFIMSFIFRLDKFGNKDKIQPGVTVW